MSTETEHDKITHDIYDPLHVVKPPPPPPKSKWKMSKLEQNKRKSKLRLFVHTVAESKPPKRSLKSTDERQRHDSNSSETNEEDIGAAVVETRRKSPWQNDVVSNLLTANKDSASTEWVSEELQVLVEPKKFLFQIERNPASFGPTVYKSYDLFVNNGQRIFSIVNHSSGAYDEAVSEYRMVGPDGSVAVTFEQPVLKWGDEDFCSCFPRRHESDGIQVISRDTEIGCITVKDCAYKPCIFSGWRTRPCCSRYHVQYIIQYIDGNGDLHTGTTHECEYFGLEIIEDNGQILGEISIAPLSNRRINRDPSPDFMLLLRNIPIHPNGKAVLIGLAIRHQLNVLCAHKITPAMLKYGIPQTKRSKRPKPSSI